MNRVLEATLIAGLVGLAALCDPAQAVGQALLENLSRGVVAVRTGEKSVYVSWRLLGTDPQGVAFNVYRSSGAGQLVKINDAPLTQTTDFTDMTADPAVSQRYSIRPVAGGRELASEEVFEVPAGAASRAYLTVPLQRPAGGPVDVPAGARTASYHLRPERRERRRPRRRRRVRDRRSSGIPRTRGTPPRRDCPAGRSSTPTGSTARGSGASISAGTSVPARTTRSSSSTTSTATAAPKWRARPPTARSTARAGSSATPRRTTARSRYRPTARSVKDASDRRYRQGARGP